MTLHHRHLDWEKTAPCEPTLPALLSWGAENHGATDLLVQDDARLTYSGAKARSAALAAKLLDNGVGKGARIGILLPNGSEFVVSWLAVVCIGAVAVPISTLSSAAELARILHSSGISLLIGTDSFHRIDFVERLEAALGLAGRNRAIASPSVPLLREIWLWRGEATWAFPIVADAGKIQAEIVKGAQASVRPADEATIIYTSGSTSEPKGVRHSQGSLMRSSRRWAASMPFQQADRLFANAPMFWVGGLVTSLLAMMQVGATLVTSTSSDASVILDAIEKERCTLLQLWPLLARRLVRHPSFPQRDFGAMRAATELSFVPAELRSDGPNAFGLGMGMRETAGPHALAMDNADRRSDGAMGVLAPGMEHRIVDPESGAILRPGERGELHVRGDTMMLGYVGRDPSETFDRDGWFATGDLCSLRDDHIFFHGRADAMIKTAGANVSPLEVEAALLTIEGVGEACVVGLPDAERGQVVGALVVALPGIELAQADIVQGAASLLSAYKVPRRLLIIDAMPITATNKADRPAVQRMLEADS